VEDQRAGIPDALKYLGQKRIIGSIHSERNRIFVCRDRFLISIRGLPMIAGNEINGHCEVRYTVFTPRLRDVYSQGNSLAGNYLLGAGAPEPVIRSNPWLPLRKFV
jgi:hypothetical protein